MVVFVHEPGRQIHMEFTAKFVFTVDAEVSLVLGVFVIRKWCSLGSRRNRNRWAGGWWRGGGRRWLNAAWKCICDYFGLVHTHTHGIRHKEIGISSIFFPSARSRDFTCFSLSWALSVFCFAKVDEWGNRTLWNPYAAILIRIIRCDGVDCAERRKHSQCQKMLRLIQLHQ